MDSPAVPPVPAVDTGRVARVRDALAGGYLCYEHDRRGAALIRSADPDAAKLPRAAWRFHCDAALWAATETSLAPPARAVVFTAPGLPPPRRTPLHEAAARAVPGCRFGYAVADPNTAAAVRAALRGSPGAPVVHGGSAGDPQAVLRAAARAGLPVGGPVSVHVVLAPQWWPGEAAAAVVAGYARLLEPGSTLALTAISAGPGNEGFLEAVTAATGARMYPHSAEEIAGWLADAGMRPHPWGVRDAESWGRPAAVRGDGRPCVLEAVGIVR